MHLKLRGLTAELYSTKGYMVLKQLPCQPMKTRDMEVLKGYLTINKMGTTLLRLIKTQ